MPKLAWEPLPDHRQLICVGAVEGACLLLEHGADAWTLIVHSRRFKTLARAISAMKLDRKLHLPAGYLQAAQQAMDSFSYALVFDASRACASAPMPCLVLAVGLDKPTMCSVAKGKQQDV